MRSGTHVASRMTETTKSYARHRKGEQPNGNEREACELFSRDSGSTGADNSFLDVSNAVGFAYRA